MTTWILLVVVGLGLVGVLVALARTVRADGPGHRPPPRSHPDAGAGR